VPSRRRGGLIGTLPRVLQPGDRVPDVTVFDTDVRPVRLAEFAAQGPLLLAFYLYDWTGT
jgi:peroxiredoxin